MKLLFLQSKGGKLLEFSCGWIYKHQLKEADFPPEKFTIIQYEWVMAVICSFLAFPNQSLVRCFPYKLDSPLSALDVLHEPYPTSVTESENHLAIGNWLWTMVFSQDQNPARAHSFVNLTTASWHKYVPDRLTKSLLWKIYFKILKFSFFPAWDKEELLGRIIKERRF